MSTENKNATIISISSLHPAQVATLLDRVYVAEKLISSIKNQAKEMLKENPESIPGYSLGKGRVTETITKPQEVFDRFSATGGTLEQFMSCISVGKTKLKEKVASVTNTKGKALESLMDNITIGCTETKESEPSIIKTKEPK